VRCFCGFSHLTILILFLSCLQINAHRILMAVLKTRRYSVVQRCRRCPAPPFSCQPLGRGHRNKAMNRFSDALAHEQLDSDEEDLNAFTEASKRKHAVHASNISGGAGPPTLSSSNSFETLPVEESSDDNEDGSFKSDSGSESDSDSSDKSTPNLKLISNDEVRAQLFSHVLECLPDIIAACHVLPRKTVVDLSHGSRKQLRKKTSHKRKAAKAQSGSKCARVTMEEIPDEQRWSRLQLLYDVH